MILEHVTKTALLQIETSVNQLQNSNIVYDLQEVVSQLRDYRRGDFNSNLIEIDSDSVSDILTELDKIEADTHKEGNTYFNIYNPVWRAFRRIESLRENTVLKTFNALKNSTEITLGAGCESVYLFYYNCHREMAASKNEPTWDCCLKATKDDPYIETLDTVFNYDLPGFPVPILVFNSENAFDDWDTVRFELSNNFLKIVPDTHEVLFKTSPSDVESVLSKIRTEGYTYKHKWQPLNDAIGAELISKLFQGQVEHEDTIFEKVIDFHTKRGGMLESNCV